MCGRFAIDENHKKLADHCNLSGDKAGISKVQLRPHSPFTIMRAPASP